MQMKINQQPLLFPQIVQAVSGDIIAMNEMVKYFEPYVNRLAQKIYFDEYGNQRIYIEEEIKQSLEAKLMRAILKFDLNR